MSGFKAPKFSRTGGSTQSNNSSKSSGFFSSLFRGSLDQSLKSKKSSTFSSGDTWQGEGTLPEDKSYYSKTTSNTATRHISASAWGGTGSTLQELAAEGDVAGVKRLLNLGEDIDSIDSEGNTALHLAAEAGFTEVVEILLSRGADANAVNEEGDTPLHKTGSVDVITLLVEHRADTNALNTSGWAALHELACNGRTACVQTLLHLGAKVDIRTNDGDTPLHKAARWGHMDIVKLLLMVGASPSVQDRLGREPWQRTNKEDIAHLLKHRDQDAQSARQQRSAAHERQQSNKHASSHEGLNQDEQRETDQSRDDAALQGDWDLADQRELYEVQWTLFVSNRNPERKLSYSDIPWPGISTAAADILQVVLYGTQTAEEKKRRLRAELLRWHPDKFQAIFGKHLKDEDAQQIMAKVSEISQCINSASKA